MSDTDGVLVIGACQAGIQLACSLREYGYPDPITVVGAERHAPYQRPPLSKAVLHGETTPGALALRSEAFYADHGIALALGERITRVDRSTGVAHALSGRAFAFGRLALAVGARPRRLPVPGADLGGVLYLRDADDALALKHALANAGHVVVIGGGFIGLEVAASARRLGHRVTVALLEDRLLGRAVGEATSAFFHGAHTRRGVQVHLGVQPVQFYGDDRGNVRGVELSDGRHITADLVVVGIGAVPRTELAEQLGLDISNGIVVDAHGVTSDGTTVAAGDCVACPPPVDLPDLPARIRFESVNTAIEQAKVAAATIAGRPVPYRVVPWFWSDQFNLKLQVAGLSSGHDRYVLRGDPEMEKFAVLYYAGERLIAGDFVNRPADFLAVKAALAGGRTISPAAATDVAVPLKKLVLT
ncbi:NAD(P)/FAD-dependent oxidoreductase [Paractinoplanes lichenicola]|uniref:FAD-dependent oxidoreductase n=1 Tax=Paractinoplanes lichenicola TaxID=2802976 RepID=A0ABS1VMM2_9ACTN|nr:FAD-dependent oxidoreductase [Actinoplanes lichenicola]MBL7255982.1 FAD-dependent oxidoreductase [Actinoplanes lichenicola]